MVTIILILGKSRNYFNTTQSKIILVTFVQIPHNCIKMSACVSAYLLKHFETDWAKMIW